MPKQHLSELDYFFKNYWDDYSEIKSVNVKTPEIEPTSSKIPVNSVFALLFNLGYSEEDYEYKFRDIGTRYYDLSIPIRERLFFNYGHVMSLLSDSTGEHYIIFNDDEILSMLDLLLVYRLTNTADLSPISYESLKKNLSKLIYIYLDAMINDNLDILNTDTLISSEDEIIESIFEIYVVNEVYRKCRHTSRIIENAVVETRPGKTKVTVDEGIYNSKQFETDEKAYNSQTDFWLFRNGNLRDRGDYRVEDTSDKTKVMWDGEELEEDIKIDDVLIAYYYVLVGEKW